MPLYVNKYVIINVKIILNVTHWSLEAEML